MVMGMHENMSLAGIYATACDICNPATWFHRWSGSAVGRARATHPLALYFTLICLLLSLLYQVVTEYRLRHTDLFFPLTHTLSLTASLFCFSW